MAVTPTLSAAFAGYALVQELLLTLQAKGLLSEADVEGIRNGAFNRLDRDENIDAKRAKALVGYS